MQAPETLQTCQQRGKLGTAADEDTHKASHLFHMCTGVPNSRPPSGKTPMGNADFQEARALGDIHVHTVGEDGWTHVTTTALPAAWLSLDPSPFS